MFKPQRTTEDLFAVPTDASHADNLNVHKDVLICKGTIVWACDVQADRWVITVDTRRDRHIQGDADESEQRNCNRRTATAQEQQRQGDFAGDHAAPRYV